MEIRRWLRYVVINYVLIISCFAAKPFSLNELIAAESKQHKRHLETTPRPKLREITAERFLLNKALSPVSLKSKKIKASGNIVPRGKKVSSFKYKKTFQIKSPLKPKKLKRQLKPRHKRRNQSFKREIINNEEFKQKYIPLLRNLGLLFDNILTDDSGESTEMDRIKQKRYRHRSKERSGVVSCIHKSDLEVGESRPPKETVIVTTTPREIATTIEPVESETPATTTDYTPTSDVSSLGQNTDIPLLLSGDTSSRRGDANGFSERSSPAFYRSIKGDITGDHRNSQYHTGSRQNDSSATNDKENPSSAARHGANRNEHEGVAGYRGIYGISGVRGNESDAESPVYRGIEANQLPEDENSKERLRGKLDHFETENKFETRGDQTKGTTILPKFVPGFRGSVPEDKIGNNAESVQPEAYHEKGIYDIAGDQRVADRNGAFASKNKKVSPANKAEITFEDFPNPIVPVNGSPQHKPPMVTIIDGYSVARDINGQNKLAEKSIYVHS